MGPLKLGFGWWKLSLYQISDSKGRKKDKEAGKIRTVEAVDLLPTGFPSQLCFDIFVINDMEESYKGSTLFQIMYGTF
jgi:hypothetical protein